MDFSGLVKAVHEFWDFIWPPVICLVILLSIMRYLAIDTLKSIWERGARSRPTSAAQRSAYKTLKRFGLDKLLPIAAAFCLLFLMDVARTTVLEVGRALTPTISYRDDVWFAQHSRNVDVRCLWSYYGDEPTLTEFGEEIRQTLGEEKAVNKGASLLEEVNDWEARDGSAHVALSACTFFATWAIFWAAVEVFRTRKTPQPGRRLGRRLAGCLIVLAVAGGFFFYRQIWAADQAEFSRISAAKVFLAQKSAKPPCSSMTAAQQKAFDEMVERERNNMRNAGERRWWEIGGLTAYKIGWVWKQITGEHP
jgi:hypothetical protein